MTLPTRNLDDRKFQEIVDEAKKRITTSCPEWTDHNVSDPGVTLVELFAWMTEMVLYRLNQVPEKNYIKFLEVLGLKLQEPEPACVLLTFYLAAPQSHAIVIPAGTEAATVRTETRPSIIFSTDEALTLYPSRLMSLFARDVSSTDGGENPTDQVHPLQQLGAATFPVFHARPTIGNALYLGFEDDMSYHVLALDVDCPTATSLGIDPNNPPWQWEAWFGGEGDQRWLPVEVEQDGTGGLSYSGQILLRLPRLTPHEYVGCRGYWLRCRVVQATTGRDYDQSPVIKDLKVNTWGGTVRATNTSIVEGEELGRSDGSPGQTFRVEHTPLLRRKNGETIEVLAPGSTEWDKWTEVPDFSNSGPNDRHFTCESATGQVQFGPTLRVPQDKARSFGSIPPRGATIRFSSYRYGGGVEGNVQAGTLTVRKTSIPYVDRTFNHVDATGGVDAETIEMLQMRAPQLLRSRGRAVTSADYEFLARQADPRVQHARCVQAPGVGQVYVLLVPRVNRPEGRIPPASLKIPDDLRESVRRELDQRRLLTVQMDIREPEYAWVSAEITLTANHDADPRRVQAAVESRLYRFLNPIVGGPGGDGWPFGRDLYPSDVYACLQGMQDIEFTESVRLYRIQPNGDRALIADRLQVPSHALVASAEHQVKVNFAK